MLSNACSGAALLVEAANMGDPDAQYELGCRLRIEVFTSCPLFFLLNESITRFSAREWTFDICSLELIICPGCSRRMTMFSLINRLSITLSKLLTRYAVRYLLECWLYSFWCAIRWACFIFHLNPWLQLHPGALYLLGAVYLTGDCVKRDIASAMWCFHRASEKVSDFSLRISSMKYELDAQVSVSFIYT